MMKMDKKENIKHNKKADMLVDPLRQRTMHSPWWVGFSSRLQGSKLEEG
jgi:hypothetical protein